MSVLFFHLNPAWAQGGFIGVDVFFVISGYLITGQIRKDIANGAFTVKKFYLRRIRRIVPPLLVMLGAVSFGGWLVLEPEDIRSFAYSLIVQPLSLQNLVFLSEGDYFRGSETKALLHTWSLAVEEQFYLFWPLLLLLFKRVSLKSTLLLVFILISASFYLSATLTASEPKAAFFLIFTRAWELGLGGLAALLHEHKRSKPIIGQWQQEILGGLSIAALGCAIFFINSSMLFPGVIALLPVLAAFVLVFLDSKPQSKIGKLLSTPVLVNIGLISYPLYLWHWPVLVLFHHMQMKVTDTLPFFGFWTASLGLAYASYRWIELPIRRREWLASSRSLLIAVALCFASLIAFGVHIVVSDGAAYRFNEKARAFLSARIQSYTKRCDVSVRLSDPRSVICKHREEAIDHRKILLWGNSHASMLIPMLAQLAEQNKTSLYVNTRNSRPLIEVAVSNADVYSKIMLAIKEKSIDSVIFAASWEGLEKPELELQFTHTVQTLSKQNIAVWLVVDIPGGAELDPIAAYAKNPKDPQPGSISLASYNGQSRLQERELFERLVKQFPNVHLIDASSVFCDQSRCWGGHGYEVWYRDATHLNNAGANAVSKFFLPAFLP